MLVIRLLRIGKKNQPSYKIVVTDKRRAPRGGRFVEQVGSWNPLTKKRILNKESIKAWISKGAKPSDTIYNMLLQEKVLEGKKIPVHKKSKKAQPAAAEVKPAEVKPAGAKPEEKPVPAEIDKKA